MAKNKLSYAQRTTIVSDAIRAVFQGDGVYTWTEDVFDDYAVVNVERPGQARELFSIDYNWDGAQVVLGDPVQVRREVSYVSFSTDTEHGVLFGANIKVNKDGTFSVPALLFECGDYPDKGFSLTQEEADEWVGASSLPILLDHKAGVFHEGNAFSIGTVVRTWREENQILGEIKFEGWVKPGLAGKRVPLSVGFDAVTKRPVEVSLVTNPRVLTAQLLETVFSEKEERTGPLMSTLTKIRELFAGATPGEKDQITADFAATPPPPAVPVAPAINDNADSAKDEEIRNLRKEVAKGNAAKFVEKFAPKLTPASKAHACAVFEHVFVGSSITTFDDAAIATVPVAKALTEFMASLPDLAGLTPGQTATEMSATAPEGSGSIFDLPTTVGGAS